MYCSIFSSYRYIFCAACKSKPSSELLEIERDRLKIERELLNLEEKRTALAEKTVQLLETLVNRTTKPSQDIFDIMNAKY
jgi:hypothetical protein